jgi:hypothetical protein
MGQIGQPVRRYTVVPLEEPVSPTAEPATPPPPSKAPNPALPSPNRNRRISPDVVHGYEPK